jgi:hypothetical protein
MNGLRSASQTLLAKPHINQPRGKGLSMSEGNKPATQFRLGNMTATVWQNGRHYTTVLSARSRPRCYASITTLLLSPTIQRVGLLAMMA